MPEALMLFCMTCIVSMSCLVIFLLLCEGTHFVVDLDL